MESVKCMICGRLIRNPKFMELGMGPICLRRHELKSQSSTISLSPEKQAENLFKSILKNTEFAGKVYSVGGFVRDDILGRNSKDLDLVIEMNGGAKKLGEFLHSRFPDETSKALQLGESYPIYNISFKKDLILDGETYHVAGVKIDIADTQKESFPDSESRQRVSTFGTIDEDIKRRDFTVNMLIRDLSTGQIVDKVSGIEDIKRGILRGHPDVDLDKTFSDDPLRMIRLIRFQSKYNWQVPLSVIKKVKKNADRIKIVSQERIRDELIKVMDYGKLANAIKFFKVSGLLQHILPEIHAMDKVKQDYRWHSEGDVFKHTLMVTKKAKPNPIAQLSALLHDVGKPGAQTIEGDRIKFLGHENLSAELTEAILKRMKFDNLTTEKVKKIVLNHLRGHFSKDWSNKAVRKYMRECGDELEEILDLTEIDGLSSFGPDRKPKENVIPELRKKIEEQKKIPIKKQPILNGAEVMKLLGLSQGVDVGKAVTLLRDIEDEWASSGTEISVDVAKSELKKRWT